ncbi:MAG: sulfatase [Planctomycetota bacterium]|nr:sulfatase [Planctomycetota bacterium]
MKFLQAIPFILFLFWAIPAGLAANEKRPDVVFIIVDDLNDWLGCLGGHPNAKSPHMDSLAAGGMLFTQAYCNSPQCRPSRTSLNHGVYPFRTGIYFNARFRGETRVTTPTMQQFYMGHGYRVVSGGKVFHGTPGKHGDVLFQKPKDPKPPKGKDKFNPVGVPSDGFALDVADREMSDYKVASWAINQWKTPSEKPLFMSVGFYRPHRPLQVPKTWFEKFPLDSIRRPEEPEGVDDWEDLPMFARQLARSHAHKPMHRMPGGKRLSDHEHIVTHQEWDATIRAYQASVAFVDQQIGRFVQALEENPRGRETYIMLVSDHGWHLGEKKHWCKGAIWEQTTRIPFIVRGPGVRAGSRCNQPVSLIDVYPSLLDFAGLEAPSWLDGSSVGPQLKDPARKRSAAISSYGAGNTSIRTENWRYIRYEDGSEELYDHRQDPNEWSNLASSPKYREIKEQLSAKIPVEQHAGLRVQDWFERYQK